MEAVFEAEKDVKREGKIVTTKRERMPVKTSLGGLMRQRLSDITNTHHQKSSDSKDGNQKPTYKEYIEQLLKERTTLLSLLAERTKIIEVSGIELQKLKLNLQKASQQNWQLAQVNSQMLAELNLAKDKLKASNHEYGCMVAMLKAKNSELEEKLNKTSKNIGTKDKTAVYQEIAEASHKSDSNNKQCKLNRRGQPRSQSSSEPCTVTQLVAIKETFDNKRICRRRSSMLKSNKCEPTEDLFEIEDANFPVCQLHNEETMHEDVLTLSDSLSASISNNAVKPKKEGEQGPSTLQHRTSILGRSSTGRPLRRAAEKVCSYKEIPLKVKMRRSQ